MTAWELTKFVAAVAGAGFFLGLLAFVPLTRWLPEGFRNYRARCRIREITRGNRLYPYGITRP